MSVQLTDDRNHIFLAAQTILLLHKDQLSISPHTIEQLSREIVSKALMFKQISEEVKNEVESEQRSWRMLVENLSNRELMESYITARKLRLEEEFIFLLLEEMNKRGIDIQSVEEVEDESAATSMN